MKRMLAALFFIALSMWSAAIVHASVPFPIVEQASGAGLATLLKTIAPAVVSISTKSDHPDPAKKGRADNEHQGTGSGVIVDAQAGLIVTNHHVIEHADEITVFLADRRQLPAKLLGTDPETDIAVLKVAADNLTALPLGDSDAVQVGDFVLAVGNSPRIGESVTSGIVSGLNRNNLGIDHYENFIQTDAAIYPDDSGGALVDLRGDLIGIDTAVSGNSNITPGMGFAIPVNMVRAIVERVVKNGDLRRGVVGIAFTDPPPGSGPALVFDERVPLSEAHARPVITKVERDSAAERAGLKVGDVVTALDGKPVRDSDDLRTKLGFLWVGDNAEFSVTRNGQPLQLRIVA
jgi:serine protease DegQ